MIQINPFNDSILEWHRRFAWWPVRLQEGGSAWLRTVWRRGIPLGFGFRRSFVWIYSLEKPAEQD